MISLFNSKTNRSDKQSRSRVRSSKRRSSSRAVEREQEAKRANMAKVTALSAAVIGGIGVGYPYVQNLANIVKQDVDTACYNLPGQKYSASFIDYSTTHLFSSPEHSIALKTNFENVYELLSPNQKLEVFTTNKNTTSNVVKPDFTVCRPASTLNQHQALQQISPSIADKSLAQLTYSADKARADYDANIDRIIQESQNSGNNEFWKSPILHRIKGISRYYKDRGVQLDELIIFSDGIENSNTVHFCSHQNHLPSWENFKKRRIYQDIKPLDSFTGAKITFLMPDVVDRYGIGPHCTQDEIEDFWRGYFTEAGAREVDIQSIGAMSFLELGVMLASAGRLINWVKNKAVA